MLSINKKTFWILAGLATLGMNTASVAQSDTLTSSSKTYPAKLGRENLKKGRLTVGLYGIVTFENYGDPNSNWFLTPQIGYLLANRWVAGVQLAASRYYLAKQKMGSSSSGTHPDYDVYSLAPEIYSRYYLFPSRFTPFIQLSSGYSVQWGNKSDLASAKSQDLVVSGAIGLSVLITKRIRAEVLYNHGFISGSQLNYPSNLQKFRLGVSAYIK